MSRSGYSDDCENLALWRQAVERAAKGRRGQAMLRELLEALDAMPDKRIYSGSFATAEGEFCTLGVLGAKRGTKMDDLGDEDWTDTDRVGERFGVAKALAAEIMYENDEMDDDWAYVEMTICGPMRPHYPHWERHERSVRVSVPNAAERRWQRMRNWVAAQLTDRRLGEGLR